MEQGFLSIYYFFQRRKSAFWFTFISIFVVLGLLASRVKIEEDISKFFPDDERVEKLNYVFRNAKLAERLVVMISVRDSALKPNADSLVAFADRILPELDVNLKSHVSSISGRIDDSKITTLVAGIQEQLPFLLDEKDYAQVDSLIAPRNINDALKNSYNQLVSPTGLLTNRLIINDPVGISFLALRKLQNLQVDNNVEIYDNYLVTTDHRHLIFFIQPLFKASDTGNNLALINELDATLENASKHSNYITASYFGGTAVAVANAKQLQRDTYITLSLMFILLAIIFFSFFRKKRVPFLILIPVLFGAVFSLACVYLVQGTISILALAAGSIILGIAINYSLHFLSHLKHAADVAQTIKDLVKPMTIGSATTVLAFFCLQFVNAAVLRDVGLFAAFSLIGAALCSLIFLPHFIRRGTYSQHHNDSWIERFASISLDQRRGLVFVIFILTPVFLYFAKDVSFNSDLSQLNFMSEELKTSQQRLEQINKASLSSVYIVSQSGTLQKALQKNEVTSKVLEQLKDQGSVQRYSSISNFLLSDSLQRVRLAKWKTFWTHDKISNVMAQVKQLGGDLHFSTKVFSNFENLLTREYIAIDTAFIKELRSGFFDDYIIEKDGLATIISLANVSTNDKPAVYASLKTTPANAFDRQMLTNLFVEYVHADFNFIVTFTSALVFLALLLTYGRIELTLITFFPMLITWIWILGIMALLNIEFNIVNVMISTFIFGLGDDYSIFTMDGLQQEYAHGKNNISSIRSSIFLSALTTISGLGVLIFAQHPALRSIATISIIGIVCVFIMSQTIEPFLFRWLITRRTALGYAPMTIWGMVRTFFHYGFFILGSFLLTIMGVLLKLIPFGRKRVQFFYHQLISSYTRALVYLAPAIRPRIEGKTPATFNRASVIIANHSSFMDILLTVMLHPKIILMTNKWVYNSPIFGGVVRLAEYYPVMEGAEPGIEKLQLKVREGYSLVVFPEGTRSIDGTIKRFHKGAFFLAEALKVPILPLVIDGAGIAIPKGHFYVNPSKIILKFMSPIEPGDTRFGETYSERAKMIGREFRHQHHELQVRERSVNDFSYRLISNYLYKGPVLEWYMRVKIRLENNYDVFEKLVPKDAAVLDLGCGYGFLCYMLSFMSAERTITGVDYDEEKISVANNCYSKHEKLKFYAHDIVTFPMGTYDTIVIADVLHYLLPEDQERVLVNCFHSIRRGGKIIVRDGNADLKDRHQGTKLTELFSVKLLKFNKSKNELHFISGERLSTLAATHGFSVDVLDNTRYTSNIIFVISKVS